MYWLEDISKINRIQAQLAEINAQLSEENELIQAENELKRQRAQIEEQNRLMDAMLSACAAAAACRLTACCRIESAQSLNAHNLKQVCLLGAYVKRRVNLALICDQKTVVPCGRADPLHPGIADLSDAVRRCLRAASGGKRQRAQLRRANRLRLLRGLPGGRAALAQRADGASWNAASAFPSA